MRSALVRRARPWLAAAAVVGLGLHGGLLRATGAIGAEPDGRRDDATILNLQWENDIFSGRGTDRHYTNGLRASVLLGEDRIPGWVRSGAQVLPWLPAGGRVRGAWSVGQNLYTPEDIKTDALVEDDRPYAGWLYVGAGLVAENGRVLDLLELSVGVIGPSARGRETQKGIHSIIGSPEPRGWSHQLPDEPAVQLSWQRKWRRFHDIEASGLEVDFMPHLAAALGNVFIDAAAGGTVRVGIDLSADYGPPRIQPSLPGSEYFAPRRRLVGYLFAGAEARGVLRNIFLDGSTFKDSHAVEKRRLVGDVQAGTALAYRSFRLTFTYVVRTQEFDGQDGVDTFGAFTLAVRL